MSKFNYWTLGLSSIIHPNHWEFPFSCILFQPPLCHLSNLHSLLLANDSIQPSSFILHHEVHVLLPSCLRFASTWIKWIQAIIEIRLKMMIETNDPNYQLTILFLINWVNDVNHQLLHYCFYCNYNLLVLKKIFTIRCILIFIVSFIHLFLWYLNSGPCAY
jgi:hypothetical protein